MSTKTVSWSLIRLLVACYFAAVANCISTMVAYQMIRSRAETYYELQWDRILLSAIIALGVGNSFFRLSYFVSVVVDLATSIGIGFVTSVALVNLQSPRPHPGFATGMIGVILCDPSGVIFFSVLICSLMFLSMRKIRNATIVTKNSNGITIRELLLSMLVTGLWFGLWVTRTVVT